MALSYTPGKPSARLEEFRGIIIYHHFIKPSTEPGKGYFGLCVCRDEKSRNWEIAENKLQLEERVLFWAQRKHFPILDIQNRIPFVDDYNATLLVTTDPSTGHTDTYRPLNEDEIPKKIKMYVMRIKH